MPNKITVDLSNLAKLLDSDDFEGLCDHIFDGVNQDLRNLDFTIDKYDGYYCNDCTSIKASKLKIVDNLNLLKSKLMKGV